MKIIRFVGNKVCLYTIYHLPLSWLDRVQAENPFQNVSGENEWNILFQSTSISLIVTVELYYIMNGYRVLVATCCDMLHFSMYPRLSVVVM